MRYTFDKSGVYAIHVAGKIVIEAVVMGMMDVGEMKRIFRIKPIEFLSALAALLGVMTLRLAASWPSWRPRRIGKRCTRLPK